MKDKPMKIKRITYDIPTGLDAILSTHAQYLGIDKGGIVLDCIARKVQADLSNLSLTHPQYIEPLKGIHAWRMEQGALRQSGIQPPSNVEHVLIACIATPHPHPHQHQTHNERHTHTITPCKRTRGYLRIPHNLLTLINTLPYTPLNDFITLAVFDGLEHRLSTQPEDELMQANQEYIPARSTHEQRQLLAELRDLRLRLTNLEAQVRPSNTASELMLEVFLQLVNEEASRRTRKLLK